MAACLAPLNEEPMADPQQVRAQLREFALRLPGAYEDFPWGESVAKVSKKVFVFLGVEDSEQYPPGFTVKLRESNGHALSLDGAEPAGYGLGRAGWVSISLTGELPPLEVLLDWVEESYRIVAPKRRVAELDERHAR
jgi:predicted DNA-binding protein (MmcQ/YjbR family)